MLREKTERLNVLVLLLTLLAFATITVVAQNGTLQTKKHQVKSRSLERAFERAAVEFGIPSELLKTIAYSETHFDNHNGEPSMDNGYGVMHLADNNENQSLNRAAAILQVPADVLKKDDWQNIRGGAAILREYANQEGLTAADRKNIEAWYPVVAFYTNASSQSMAKFYADEIYKLLQSGFSGTTPNGEVIIVVARDVKSERGELEGDVASRIE